MGVNMILYHRQLLPISSRCIICDGVRWHYESVLLQIVHPVLGLWIPNLALWWSLHCC